MGIVQLNVKDNIYYTALQHKKELEIQVPVTGVYGVSFVHLVGVTFAMYFGVRQNCDGKSSW